MNVCVLNFHRARLRQRYSARLVSSQWSSIGHIRPPGVVFKLWRIQDREVANLQAFGLALVLPPRS